jgi:phage gp29-like protein
MTKLATLAGLALLLTVGYATAQQNTMSAGRPSAVLTPDQCNAIWSKAATSGDTLAQANAAPYIVNFAQVDTNNDGNIDKKEFDAACGKGMVKNPQ